MEYLNLEEDKNNEILNEVFQSARIDFKKGRAQSGISMI